MYGTSDHRNSQSGIQKNELRYFEPAESIALQNHFIRPKDNMGGCLSVLDNIEVPNLAKITVNIPKYMFLCSSKDSIIFIIDTEQVHKERRHILATLKSNWKPFVKVVKRTDAHETSKE